MTRSMIYISAAAAGTIDVFSLDAGSGLLTLLGSADAGGTPGPTAVSPDGKFLYAVLRSEPHGIRTFAINPATGTLQLVAEAPLPASMPYLSVTDDGRSLLSASYGSSCVAISPVDADGRVTAAPVQVAATARHAHAIITDRSGQFVFVPCLGSDEILIFRRDARTGKLAPHEQSAVSAPAGAGPRHAIMSPDNRTLFVIGEFTGDILCYRFDEVTGRLTHAGIVASVDPSFGMKPGMLDGEKDAQTIWAADIKMTRDGRFLYASERTGSRITRLAWDGTSLVRQDSIATEKQPRGIGIDPSGRWLIATGEKSDHVACYAIDAATGALSLAARAPASAGGNWVSFATLA